MPTMTPEERQAFAKEVASMVLLQTFVPMDKIGTALIIAHEKIDLLTKTVGTMTTTMTALIDLLKATLPGPQGQAAPRMPTKPSLNVVPLAPPDGRTD